MTYKQIEASREVRLWLTQIIAPAGLAAAVILSKPERREKLKTRITECKDKITSKFQKKS